MIVQERGAQVKGPWDPLLGKRSLVTLPPLPADKQRRAIYFHKPYKQYMAKLKQYDDKINLIQRKKGLFGMQNVATNVNIVHRDVGDGSESSIGGTE